MNYRWKTIGGLLLVALVGGAAALVFYRRQRDDRAPGAESAAVGQSASPSRGRILPLIVDEGEPLPAFVPAMGHAARDDGPSSMERVQTLPTIRASAASENVEAPALAHDFPRTANLAAESEESDDAFTPIAAGDAAFAPISPLTRAAKPAVASAIRHVVVDGDSLPLLAERYLGDRSRAQEIFAQNREVLPSPEILPLGATIVIGSAP